MPSTVEQVKEELDEALKIILDDGEGPYPILSETDRDRFMAAEESLRAQLKDIIGSSSSGWRGLLCLPSSQAVKCLQNAKELHRRVKEETMSKRKARFSRKINPTSPSSHLNSRDTHLVGTDSPHNSRPPTVVVSPSEDVTSKLDESSSLESSRAVDSSFLRRRSLRSPPPPPLRRVSPLNDSRPISEASSNSGSDSPRRLSTTRRPAPPPPSPGHSISSRSTGDAITPHALLPSGVTASTGISSNSPSHISITRRPAPPPPSPRHSISLRSPTNDPITPSAPLAPDAITSTDTSSDPLRRSSSVRRPAPPPPSHRHSISLRSPTGDSIIPSVSSPPDGSASTGTSGVSPRRSSSVRRPAPPPPQSPRQSATNSWRASDFSSAGVVPKMSTATLASRNSSDSSSRRSSSVRRSLPPPPHSAGSPGSSRSPIRFTFTSPGSGPPDEAMIASMSKFAQQMSTFASSVVAESMSGLEQGQHKTRRNGYVSKTNCIDITGSNVDGVTLNNGGRNNSGAVIHKTVMSPPRDL